MAAITHEQNRALNLSRSRYFWLLTGAIVGSIVFGAGIGLVHPNLTPLRGGLFLTLSAGAGWALALVVFGVLFRQRYWEFVSSCLLVMNIGVLFLMAPTLGLVAAWHFGWPYPAPQMIILIGVCLDGLLMFASFVCISKKRTFPSWVPYAWLVLLQAGGLPFLTGCQLLYF